MGTGGSTESQVAEQIRSKPPAREGANRERTRRWCPGRGANRYAAFTIRVFANGVGRGSGVMTGLSPGPNSKGRVGEEIKLQWQELHGDAADPLTDQQLPRGYRDHAKKYFDTLREGKEEK